MPTLFIPTQTNSKRDELFRIETRELYAMLKKNGFHPLRFVMIRSETAQWGWCWAWTDETDVIKKFNEKIRETWE